ncbi:MAG: helix-turn-helix domain-containing protein [Candidatus Saccharibacteria bacterium]
MNNDSDIIEFLMLLFRAGAVVFRKFGGQGLGFGDVAPLYALSRAPDKKLKLKELAERLGMPLPMMPRLLTSLEKVGAVTRGKAGEGELVSITVKGEDMLEKSLTLAKLRFANLIPKEQAENLKTANEVLGSIRE